MRLLARWWKIVRGAVLEFLRDNSLTFAAAISYTAVLSIFPALLGLIALFGQFLEQADVQQVLLGTLSQYLPPPSMDLVQANIRAVIDARGSIGIVAIATLLWSASAIGGAVRNGLNVIVGAGRPRSWIAGKAIEVGIVLLGGLALLLSVAVTAAVRILAGLGEGWFSVVTSAAGRIAGWLLPVASVAVALSLLYRFVPNVRLPTRSLALGAVVGAVLFEAVKAGFFWYLQSIASYQLIYGSVAGVVIFLVWVYLSATILLFGAELAAQHAAASGRAAEVPAPVGQTQPS